MYQITFGDHASYDDWGLQCQSNVLAPAVPRTAYLTINGMDGSYNMTEVVHGRVVYQDRLLTTVLLSFVSDETAFESKCQAIDAVLNGSTMAIVQDSDPDHYLLGEAYATSVRAGTVGTHTITATCRPFRYCNDLTEQTVVVDEQTTATFDNQELVATPTFITESTGMSVVFGNTEYSLTADGCTIPGIYFVQGETTLTFKGSGTVVVSWQEGVR